MTRHPFDSGELGRNDPEMDRLGESLERYATDAAGEPSLDLSSRIMAAIDDEPVPSRGWWGSLLAAFAPWHGPARLALGAAVVAAAVIGALALGDLADRARNNTGATPSPTEVVSPSPTPTAEPDAFAEPIGDPFADAERHSDPDVRAGDANADRNGRPWRRSGYAEPERVGQQRTRRWQQRTGWRGLGAGACLEHRRIDDASRVHGTPGDRAHLVRGAGAVVRRAHPGLLGGAEAEPPIEARRSEDGDEGLVAPVGNREGLMHEGRTDPASCVRRQHRERCESQGIAPRTAGWIRLETDAADQDMPQHAPVARDRDQRELREEVRAGSDRIDELRLGRAAKRLAMQLVDLIEIDG